MGLLDSLTGAAGQMMQNDGQGAPLVEAVMRMLNQGGAQGGLEGLVRQFTQSGLGDVVQSWIGTGANQPISADQVQQALGHGPLNELAQQVGGSSSDLARQLAQFLPGLVDKLTPDGQIPQQDSLEKMLGSLGIGK